MTKDSPTPLGGGRASPKKPGSPGPATAVLEEQRRELEKLRAELEAERARGRSERRRFANQARQLRESAEQERQQLADHLRSKWEARRLRELRQLQDEVQREREAEIRQLLRWKEAELRQLQQLLHQERDGVVRQARELQRQLAQELVNRGYCGRSGASEDPAAQCRCRLQEVLALLRWETDGEQAARIRHLQAALDLERQLFLKYILEHFRWQPPFPGPADLQITHSLEEPPLEAQSNTRGSPKPARRLGSLESLNSGARVCSPNDLLPTRASSLESLATAHSCSLNNTLNCSQASESEVRASSTSASTPDTSSPQPSLQVPSIHRNPGDLQEESSENKPCEEALTPSPPGLDYHDLVRQNSELAEALQVLVRRCCGLREENLQLRRSGFSDEADEKVKWLKVKHAELTDLAQRLEDRARKLQETNLRAVCATIPGESLGGLDLGQGFAHQRVQDLSEQADVLQAKDLQIEALRRKCHLLQARVAADLGSYSHPGEGATCTQLCNINDLDRLQRESQREVLRLQRQLTLQQRKAGSQAEAGSLSAPSEKARHQVQALERELGAQRRECEELSAQAAAAERRYEEAEAQLQAALHKGARLSEENARLQALASSVKKVADENSSVSLQQSRARQRQEPEATGLPAEQLLQQAGCAQDRQEQLRHYQNNAPSDLWAFGKETQRLQCQPGHPSETLETTQASEPQARGSRRPKFKPKSEEHSLSLPITDVQLPASLSQQENPVTPGEPAGAPQVSDRNPTSQPLDSRPQAKKTSSQSNSSSVESLWATVPSCLSLDMDTASEMDDLEPDSVSTSPEMRSSEAPTTHKLQVFLARTNYSPCEGPNEHCQGALPLTAGDYVYVCGDVDEDGFYEGELVNGQRGLVPSNLVEPISGSPVLNHLFPTSPDAGPATALPTEQSKALKGSFLREEMQGSLERGLCQAGRADSKTDIAVERLKTKTEACWQGLKPSTEEQNFSRPLLEAKGVFCLGPVQLQLQNVTATSATITWASGSNRYPHMVYLEDEEHTLTPSGVNRYTLHGLSPGTRYRVRVGVQLPQDLLPVLWETMSSTITFDTPLAGPPDPPLDVLVEHHASPGFLVVSWLPVTIDSAGSSNGVQVTGYAVYVDGFKVTEVADATAGNTLLEFSQLQVPLACQKVSVRTTSLYGESLDSVPAQIPEDCFFCYPFLEAPPFSYTDGDPSACRVAFPVCQQKALQASPSAKSSSHTPGSCGEPPATFLEAAPEEPSRKHLPVPSLSSDRANNLLRGPAEAWKGYEKDLAFQKTPQNHRPPLLFGQPGLEEVHSPQMGISGSPAPEFVRLSPETGPVKVPCWEKPGLEKALLQKQYAQMLPPHRQGSTQCHTADFHHILEEEALCLDSQYTEKPEQRKSKSQSGQRQGTPGSKRECQFLEPTSVLCPAPTSKVIKMSCGAPEELETEADSSVRVFVALFDHSPPVMPVNSEALEKELAFQKGQLLRVWGSRDAHGFYHGECNGQVGKIPGHLIVEAEVGTEQTDGRWHLLSQGHLHSEAQHEDLKGLTNSQGSFMPQGNSRTPTLWTPKTMMAALDYNPRDGRAGGPKGKLVLRAGDVVTVYGPVDDKGFYYGEYSGHRGLVPAHLLDDLPVNGE